MSSSSNPTRRATVALGVPALALAALGAIAIASSAQDGSAQESTPASDAAPVTARGAAATPAERAIELARRALAAGGATAEEQVALAVAYSRRARETADPAWYDRSDEALDAALELAPDGFAARRQQVWNQLGRHEFAAALDGALALNERARDDAATYGLIVDACVELGRYAQAEEAAQWMLNIRPGAPAAMTRVSYLRELFGDVPGAVDAMRAAFHSTRPSDAEDRAWILTHLAHLELERGRPEAATGFADSALALFPDYHYALKERARIAACVGELARARDLLERRYEIAPHPENLFELAVATAAAGDVERAALQFAEFETAALEESENLDNANLELVEYWLEHSGEPSDVARALALTRRRAETRRDVSTLAALGWALQRSGEAEAALAAFDEALAVGTRNSLVRYRAGAAAASLGDVERAQAEWNIAWQQAPESAAGQAARRALLDLERGED